MRARVSMDELAKMLNGSRSGAGLKVTRNDLIRSLLLHGFDVISDDTNLDHADVRDLERIADDFETSTAIWDLRQVPLDVCIERNSERDPSERVPEEIIMHMWMTHIQVKAD